jgi:hypothetical protein
MAESMWRSKAAHLMAARKQRKKETTDRIHPSKAYPGDLLPPTWPHL